MTPRATLRRDVTELRVAGDDAVSLETVVYAPRDLQLVRLAARSDARSSVILQTAVCAAVHSVCVCVFTCVCVYACALDAACVYVCGVRVCTCSRGSNEGLGDSEPIPPSLGKRNISRQKISLVSTHTLRTLWGSSDSNSVCPLCLDRCLRVSGYTRS